MKTQCPKACGECCRVVLITNHHYKSSLQQQWEKMNDKTHKWYLKHFREISRQEAIEIKPILKEAAVRWRGIRYFICDLYDYKRNKCKGYKRWRPYMCTDFPKYEHTILDAINFRTIPECYFITQVMKYELTNKQQEVIKLLKSRGKS